MAANADWTNARGLLAVCGPNAGGLLASSAVVHDTDDKGVACTASYAYTVSANDESVTSGYKTRK